MNSFLPHIGLVTEYQKEYLDYWGLGCTTIDRRIAAGVSYSKEQPEIEDDGVESTGLTYEAPDDDDSKDHQFISTSKFSYRPQHPLNQLPAYKPSKGTGHPPMFLMPGSQDVKSTYRSSYQAKPHELARKNQPSKAKWLQSSAGITGLEGGTPYEIMSRYQVDYCGAGIKPRKICINTPSNENSMADVPAMTMSVEKTFERNPRNAESLHDLLNRHVKPLLFRTSTGTAYPPPSAFDGVSCHPAKSEVVEKCPANNLKGRLCEIHKQHEYQDEEDSN